MYWMADTICSTDESEEINIALKVIPTMAVIWACSSPLLLTLMAVGFNYQTSLDNLESQSTYHDLKALANGTAPQPQEFAKRHHLSNLFCALSFGIPGAIIASLINQSIQNWWDSPRHKQTELTYLKKAADLREEEMVNRLEANDAFNGLTEKARTMIATQIVPALAEFHHGNDNEKQQVFATAATQVLRSHLLKNGITLANEQVAFALLDAGGISHNNATLGIANVNLVETPITPLSKAFADRIEKIAAVRSK